MAASLHGLWCSEQCHHNLWNEGRPTGPSGTVSRERKAQLLALCSRIFRLHIQEMYRAQCDVPLDGIWSSPQLHINDPMALVHSNDEKLATETVCCNQLANPWNFHIVCYFS
jgi:hypothetical protein